MAKKRTTYYAETTNKTNSRTDSKDKLIANVGAIINNTTVAKAVATA